MSLQTFFGKNLFITKMFPMPFILQHGERSVFNTLHSYPELYFSNQRLIEQRWEERRVFYI